MRIINPRDRENHDIKPPLRAIAGSGDHVKGAKAQRLLTLVDFLEAQGPTPQAGGNIFLEELWLHPFPGVASFTVAVRVDWKDYGPVEDGLPVMHYRVLVRRAGAVLTDEVRLQTPQEAGKVILRVFGSPESAR
jgi:hypothetical protein